MDDDDDAANDRRGWQDDRPTRRRRIDSPPRRLCQPCRQLRFSTIETEAMRTYRRHIREPIHDIDTRRPIVLEGADGSRHSSFDDGHCAQLLGGRILSAQSGCVLCRFFGRTMIMPRARYRNYKLMAFLGVDSAFCCLARLQRSDLCEDLCVPVYFSVVPSFDPLPPKGYLGQWIQKDIPDAGLIFPVPDDAEDTGRRLLRGRRIQQSIDFGVPREWLKFCRDNHSDCRREIPRALISRAFRLIDCLQDPPVIEECSWGTPYAALSYMWGFSQEDKIPWPRTVLDAVTATKEIGLHYLWVDRLCINQEDEAEVNYLVSQMAAIYEYAEVVIIAAAGSGAAHGLPGVRTTPRREQPSASLDDGTVLVSTCPDPRREILQSPYWTRGWTYQEAVLARRRLAFTAHQAYWECRCMAAQETIVVPLRRVHDPQLGRMADFMRSGIFHGPEYSGGETEDDGNAVLDGFYRQDSQFGFGAARDDALRSRLRGVNMHVREFTGRELGKPEDSLRAFMGVAGWYGSTEKLRLLHGIPVWVGDLPGGRAGTQMTFAFSVAAWYHLQGRFHHSYVAENRQRREHLPSWSWAGWEGEVAWVSPPTNEHAAVMCEMVRKEIDLLWAADIALSSERGEDWHIRLSEVATPSDFQRLEHVKFLIIKSPRVLSRYLVEKADQEGDDKVESFSWMTSDGRPDEEQVYTNRHSWDRHRLRLRDEDRGYKGSVVHIGLSTRIPLERWIEKHESGEFVSVLLWAGRTPCASHSGQPPRNGIGIHGSSKFLTLKKVNSGTDGPVWERVGVLQLSLRGYPHLELGGWGRLSEEEMLARMPVKLGAEAFVVQ